MGRTNRPRRARGRSRVGERFEVEVEGDPDDDRLAEVRRMAETLLANPVIEDFVVTVEALPPGEGTHPWVEPEGPLPEEIVPDGRAAGDESAPDDIDGQRVSGDRGDA